jgi:hypothetical protein
MEIKIEDLQVGDEVLIGSHMGLSRVKLLRPLKLSKKVNWKGVTPYSKVKCATNEGSYKYQIPGRTYIYTQKTTMLGDDIEYNKEKYIDFNYRNIWLIKRAEQWNKD